MLPIMTIYLSVGKGGFNSYNEVIVVQSLLNQHLAGNGKFRAHFFERGGAPVPTTGVLAEDGNCGPQTELAIFCFQHYVLRWSEARSDGRVDPGGTTWTALNGNIAYSKMPNIDANGVMVEVGNAIANIGGYQVFKQGDFTAKLGYGQNKKRPPTIKSEGCCLCSMVMACTVIGARVAGVWPDGLAPKDMTPHIANKIMKDNNGYSDAGLNTLHSVGLLGMKGDYHDGPLTSAHIGMLQSHLAQGYPVMGHVDYKDHFVAQTEKNAKGKTVYVRDENGDIVYDEFRESWGDHWVLIIPGASSGDAMKQYLALDPAYGAKMWFHPFSSLSKRYREVQLERSLNSAPLYRKERDGILFGTAGHPNYKNQPDYCLVRMVTLKPAAA